MDSGGSGASEGLHYGEDEKKEALQVVHRHVGSSNALLGLIVLQEKPCAACFLSKFVLNMFFQEKIS